MWMKIIIIKKMVYNKNAEKLVLLENCIIDFGHGLLFLHDLLSITEKNKK